MTVEIKMADPQEVFDVVIIGCGAVGAAVAREMTLLGQKCIVLEKNIDVISEASSGNTGHLVSKNSQIFSKKTKIKYACLF